ncbi:SulP family inorganic anion transporter [Mangrovimonas futianensis]|uniref:SulP family inorganic anion transporter n=1 Tax=Mangrovimonas futianensis TaxID=2895523 RepID=UPI001E3B3143|nr:SulP family inorganic anion transporter [Mangrovimonas futianensis]MCF1420858.1 SulP family inorganic anion transporter [Mangrovimonas futianensis]
MTPRKVLIKEFIGDLPKNIFSGFVVSLIALPLGLGLAMASEAPPIAGVITAIVGGLLVSFFGGSHITITGPGNGLVGVLLVAITTLGIEGAYAAIIFSGVLLMILGFLRLGKLANFFPSSAIQGMLAAIGLIILGKQFHIMLAHKIKREDTMDYLIEIPFTINDAIHYDSKGLIFAAIVGTVSLFIMFFYPKIRNKYFQLVPAPMWIVLLSIGLSYYFELVLHENNPIDKNYMISGIPHIDEIITKIPKIDFSQWATLDFWDSVVSLTLIASIESLLSIKAVDKLDPKKRRSNVNKDLKALGLATVGSGFLGGLNVVTVIARSSVNVNNGGSNRSSNFFHALFMLLFIVLFSSEMARIPLPALMAILVFTGYKLASPDTIKKVFSIGKEQFIIFFVTLIITLKVGLISGILSGVAMTLIIHIVINKNLSLFTRNLIKPNVLMYKEESGNGSFFVSVKHFCSFLNYYKLKDKLDAIPEDCDVVLDFSMCEFVDHTVMDNISSYQELFAKKGGNFEIIGLDMHDAESKHPFALRRLLTDSGLIGSNLTKRQRDLIQTSDRFGLEYHAEKNREISFLYDFHYFNTKQVNYIYNRLSNENNSLNLFDVEYFEGELIAKEVIRSTMLHISLNDEIPSFTLDKEGFLERVYSLAGLKDIDLKDYPDFSKRFYLKGDDEEGITNFFGKDLIQFFESNNYYHVQADGAHLLIFNKERLATIKEMKILLDFGKRLKEVIETKTHTTSQTERNTEL